MIRSIIKLVVLLAIIMIHTTYTPELLAEDIQEDIETQQISPWAIKDMYEAEVTEILPLDWQTTLHDPVSKEQINYILQGLIHKFEVSGLDKDEAYNDQILEFIGETRGDLLTTYYKLLQQYNMISVQENRSVETVLYMLGIIDGTDREAIRWNQACTLQEAVVFANRILGYVYEEMDAGAKGLLWQVSDEDNTVYLLGTIHLADSHQYPFHDELKQMIKEVDKVAFEVDFNNQEEMIYLHQKQLYLDGNQLKNHLPDELYTKVIQVGERFGITEEELNQLKPWTITNMYNHLALSEKEVAKTGEAQTTLPFIDMYVYTRALLENKEIIELEGYKYQANLFDNTSLTSQINELESIVDAILNEQHGVEDFTIEESAQQLEQWLDAFYIGDEQAFEKSYDKDMLLASGNELAQTLFVKRDQEMSEKIIGYLDDTNKDYLVVVGAGHMIGETGIIQRIVDAGYHVEAVD